MNVDDRVTTVTQNLDLHKDSCYPTVRKRLDNLLEEEEGTRVYRTKDEECAATFEAGFGTENTIR